VLRVAASSLNRVDLYMQRIEGGHKGRAVLRGLLRQMPLLPRG
jgi:hypothetical protein